MIEKALFLKTGKIAAALGDLPPRWPPVGGGSTPRPQIVTPIICFNYFKITNHYLILEWQLVTP